MITLNHQSFQTNRVLPSKLLWHQAEFLAVSVIALHILYNLGDEIGEYIYATTGYELLSFAPRSVTVLHHDVIKKYLGAVIGFYDNFFVKTVIMGPIVEELFFRGIQLMLPRFIPAPVRIALIALSFAYAHLPAQPGRLLALFFNGCAYGTIAETKNIYLAIAAHSLYNLTTS